MLLRGQSLVGYRHYPDDVVGSLLNVLSPTWIDIIRIFDALNDVRNIERRFSRAKREGAHAQGTISYISPLHNIDHFVRLGLDLKGVVPIRSV